MKELDGLSKFPGAFAFRYPNVGSCIKLFDLPVNCWDGLFCGLGWGGFLSRFDKSGNWGIRRMQYRACAFSLRNFASSGFCLSTKRMKSA